MVTESRAGLAKREQIEPKPGRHHCRTSLPLFPLFPFISPGNTVLVLADSKIQVGNEFSSVEALWSQFENVMAKDPEARGKDEDGDAEEEDEGEGGDGLEEDEGVLTARQEGGGA